MISIHVVVTAFLFSYVCNCPVLSDNLFLKDRNFARGSDFLEPFVHKPVGNRQQPLHKNFRIQYLVITGQANLHRARNILSTWGPSVGKTNNDSVVFISDSNIRGARGNSSVALPLGAYLPTLSVLDVMDSWGPPQLYRQSQLKWLRALMLWEAFSLFDWLVFLDDDSFVVHPAMRQLLQMHDPGSAVILARKNGNISICGGAGMVLSKGMVQKLTSLTYGPKLVLAFDSAVNDLRNNRFYSDVIFSKFVIEHELGKIVHVREFKNEGSRVIAAWYRKHPSVNKSTVITYHHVSSRAEYLALYRHYYPDDHAADLALTKADKKSDTLFAPV